MTTHHFTVHNTNVQDINEKKYSTPRISNTGLQEEECISYRLLRDGNVLYLVGGKSSLPGNTQVPVKERLPGCVCYRDAKRHVHSKNIMLFKP